ncbi:MAG: hypothetical protein ACLVJ6_00510 [Merdibacter sp.]
MCAQLGCTYNRCMEYELALNCFEQALVLDFDEPWLHYEMLWLIASSISRKMRMKKYRMRCWKCGTLRVSGGVRRLADRDGQHAQAAVYEQAFSISGSRMIR